MSQSAQAQLFHDWANLTLSVWRIVVRTSIPPRSSTHFLQPRRLRKGAERSPSVFFTAFKILGYDSFRPCLAICNHGSSCFFAGCSYTGCWQVTILRILRAPSVARVCSEDWIICHITGCLLCSVHKNLRMASGRPRLVNLETDLSSNPYRDSSVSQQFWAHLFIGLSSNPRARTHYSIFSSMNTLDFWKHWNLLTFIRTLVEIVSSQSNFKACCMPRGI